MAIITLLLTFYYKQKPVKRKMDRDLFWYDSQEVDPSKNLKKFRGGKLVYRYDFRTKRRYVEVEDIEETSHQRESNEEMIRLWIKNHGERFGVDINSDESDSKGIVINVPGEVLDTVEYSLDRFGISYQTI